MMLLCPAISFSQKTTKIDLINANTLEFDKKLGENVKRLIGSVVLKHDSTILYCDSAYLNSKATVWMLMDMCVSIRAQWL